RSHFRVLYYIFYSDPPPTYEIYTLSLHDALPISVEHYRVVVRQEPSSALAHYNLAVGLHRLGRLPEAIVQYKEALAQSSQAMKTDRKSTRLNSSHRTISYAVFCLKKKKK